MESSDFFGEESDDEIGSERYTSEEDKRQNHSEIEKRRREKMNAYIQELCGMVPTCNSMKSKLDKLTILRMAVQHVKSLRVGTVSSINETNFKPAFLAEDELKRLILEAAEGFLFVVSCDRGRMNYVSESVSHVLNISREHLIGQSLFDIMHPKDMSKVKEQLSSSGLIPRERFIDAKTGLPLKTEVITSPPRLLSGARRSFFCRMKIFNQVLMAKMEEDQMSSKKQLKQGSDRKNYITIHCTGYLKSWPLANFGSGMENENENDGCNLSCLVAIARPIQMPQPSRNESDLAQPAEFVSRHAIDGKYTFVDQRATAVLGYLPQELLGTSCYEYFHSDDIHQMAESHKAVLIGKEKILTNAYRLRAKNGVFVQLRTKMFCFRNPWTKDVEYIVCTNTLINSDAKEEADDAGNKGSLVENMVCDVGSSSKGPSIPGVPVNTHVGAGRIGRMIAEEILENEKNDSMYGMNSPSDVMLNGSRSTPQTERTIEAASVPQTEKVSYFGSSPSPSQVMTSTASKGPPENPVLGQMSSLISMTTNSTTHSVPSANGNADGGGGGGSTPGAPPGGDDEAMMALIMSLLQADAGLGGTVDLTDLPWPL
ncbi:aryl hydrocarbon receptor nuclear translocator-like protein 1 isoform X3 [Asterias rubens]|uniref:aryl hydrocarbon receptor nuclear translocator-like protein 1 isoform X3 n=1 Tax=Asterias rubens TaxID=7604 RepID=UPI00145513ED|nr:aryl hydrocarbon receptor nuclear translocator-like protein 1 isoform X3 [Asterias rubens]